MLACPEGKLDKGMPAELRSGEAPLLSEPEGGKANWCGNEIEVVVRAPLPVEPSPIQPKSEPSYVVEGPKEHPPAKAWPDMSGRTWTAGEPEILGEPISLRAPTDMMNMGSAVHGFLAADSPDYAKSDRLEMAEGLLRRWGVEPALKPDDLLEISDRLHNWVAAKWPNAIWHREWPTMMRLDSGSVAHGVADLILETPDDLVIIDHKAYPGTPADACDLALSAAEQVQVYSDAHKKSYTKPSNDTYIHLALIGVIANVTSRE